CFGGSLATSFDLVFASDAELPALFHSNDTLPPMNTMTTASTAAAMALAPNKANNRVGERRDGPGIMVGYSARDAFSTGSLRSADSLGAAGDVSGRLSRSVGSRAHLGANSSILRFRSDALLVDRPPFGFAG